MSKSSKNYGQTKGDFYNQHINAGESKNQINNAWHKSEEKSDAVEKRDFGQSTSHYDDYADFYHDCIAGSDI